MANPLTAWKEKWKDHQLKRKKVLEEMKLKKGKNPEAKNDPKIKKTKIKVDRKKLVNSYLQKAGLKIDSAGLSRLMFRVSVGVTFLFTCWILYFFSNSGGVTWGKIVLDMFMVWTLGLGAIIVILRILFYIWIDVQIFKRRIEIEEILPDFLQLASSNIKAGMTIDRALWYAVRPRFGASSP